MKRNWKDGVMGAVNLLRSYSDTFMEWAQDRSVTLEEGWRMVEELGAIVSRLFELDATLRAAGDGPAPIPGEYKVEKRMKAWREEVEDAAAYLRVFARVLDGWARKEGVAEEDGRRLDKELGAIVSRLYALDASLKASREDNSAEALRRELGL